MIVSVVYQVDLGQKFDLDYYMKTHVPLVGSLWGPCGLRGAQVLHGTGSPRGEAARYKIIALLDFESLEAFQAAAKKHGAEVIGDIANFTDVQPAIQFNELLT